MEKEQTTLHFSRDFHSSLSCPSPTPLPNQPPFLSRSQPLSLLASLTSVTPSTSLSLSYSSIQRQSVKKKLKNKKSLSRQVVREVVKEQLLIYHFPILIVELFAFFLSVPIYSLHPHCLRLYPACLC